MHTASGFQYEPAPDSPWVLLWFSQKQPQREKLVSELKLTIAARWRQYDPTEQVWRINKDMWPHALRVCRSYDLWTGREYDKATSSTLSEPAFSRQAPQPKRSAFSSGWEAENWPMGPGQQNGAAPPGGYHGGATAPPAEKAWQEFLGDTLAAQLAAAQKRIAVQQDEIVKMARTVKATQEEKTMLQLEIQALRMAVKSAQPSPASGPWSVLYLLPGAPPSVVTAAYRRLSMLYHPDRNPGVEAERKMKALNVAFSQLPHD